MSLKELHLCMGCMSPLSTDGSCEVCHYHEEKKQPDPNYLMPGSWISQRYLVGKLTSSDPEGAWYVGYDDKNGQRVWVREYAPLKLIRRQTSGKIAPLTESTAQFKALMADFDDLCKTITRLPKGEKVIPILDIVHTEDTVYAIYQYMRMISLESFLNRSGGKLSWRHTKKLLMPLYHTVANIHKAGLIHRGISPQTVMLDQNGELWLSCFTQAAARTNKSELSAQLYAGYAAPEQYHLNSWQGSWTDVYALGAITYRSLMGVNPPSANDRVYGDDLLERPESGMTEQVMVAINKALAVEIEDRIQTAEAFIAELLAHEGSNTAVYTAPARSYRQTELDDGATGEMMAQRGAADSAKTKAGSTGKRPRKKKKRANSALMWFLTAIVATGCLAGFVYWLSTNYLNDLLMPVQPDERMSGSVVQGADFDENSSIDENIVPKFVGSNIESIQSNAVLSRTFEIVVQEMYNSDYEAGVVYDQQPVEGSALPEDKRIVLLVSKGTELVEMPEVVDLPLTEAVALLDELEIKHQVIEVFNNAYDPDIVVKCDREPGSKLDKEKDTVILYIKKMEDKLTSSEEAQISSAREASSKSSSKKSSSSQKSSSESDRLLPPRPKD